MMNDILYIERFIDSPELLYEALMDSIAWDGSMASRKTVSFGKAYNYSQMSYPETPFPPLIAGLRGALEAAIGFAPNNCLVNYYADGSSKMGYHSDQTDILEADTGVAIVSLGTARCLRFRSITDPELRVDHGLAPGSLFYMGQQVQHAWQHAIPRSEASGSRISLSFRKIRDGAAG